MHIMKRTQTLVLALAVGAAVFALATPETDRNNAYRLRCELQTADGNSLDLLKWQQGTTPRISLDQYRNGKAVNADSNTVAVFRFGPSATNTYYVSVTNYAVTGNGYLVQIPTVGTNTQGNADGWWYALGEAPGPASPGPASPGPASPGPVTPPQRTPPRRRSARLAQRNPRRSDRLKKRRGDLNHH